MECEMETKMREDMIVFAKQCRVGMDSILQNMKERQECMKSAPNVCPCGRNLALAITECENSIMRLGMVLKDLNTENPYPNSYKPENTVVDPTADGLKL